MDNFGRGPTITCAAPFYDENGKIAGVVAVDLQILSFTRDIITADDYNVQTAIVDSDGRIVAAADLPERDVFISLDDTVLGEMRHDILSGDKGSVINENSFVSFIPVPSFDWVVTLLVPNEEIQKEIEGKSQEIVASHAQI